jgi:hypothetical protein
MSRKAMYPLPTGLSAWLEEERAVCLQERLAGRVWDLTALCTPPKAVWPLPTVMKKRRMKDEMEDGTAGREK